MFNGCFVCPCLSDAPVAVPMGRGCQTGPEVYVFIPYCCAAADSGETTSRTVTRANDLIAIAPPHMSKLHRIYQ